MFAASQRAVRTIVSAGAGRTADGGVGRLHKKPYAVGLLSIWILYPVQMYIVAVAR
jgi:hypothetical protein